MTSTLASRMEELEPSPAPRGRLAELARAAGVKSSSVRGWFTGKTKELSGPVLLKVADFYGVHSEWLATGKGPKWAREQLTNGDVGGSVTFGQTGAPSHPVTPDPEILHEALMLLAYDEDKAGEYLPRDKAARLSELFVRIARDGGRLSSEHNAVFVEEVRKRGVGSGEQRGARGRH